jgi:hypothetical protein
MLLDPPSVTGLPPGQISGTALPGARRHGLIAIAVMTVLALSAMAGVAVARPPGRGYAAPIIMLATPFPSSVTGGHARGPAASPGGSHPAPTAMPRPSTMKPVSTATVTPSPAMTTAPTAVSDPTTAIAPTVSVSYKVVAQRYGEFEGEVTVDNAGAAPISGWQLVVALPYDQVTAVSANARGYVSNHILLLRPAAYGDSVPAYGTLSIFFLAYGTATTPELCSFNSTSCALRRRPAASSRR